MNSHVATGSVDPHPGSGGGVPYSASVVRSKEEAKTRRERKRKDEDQDSEEGRSCTSTALALLDAGGGGSYPTSGNESFKARKKSNSGESDAWLSHARDRAKSCLLYTSDAADE